MKKLIIFFFIFSAFSALAVEWTLRPGELPAKLAASLAKPSSQLILKGTVEAVDLLALRNLPAEVRRVDMSQLSIKGAKMPKGDWFGQTLFEDGEIPSYIFLSSGVEDLVLPASLSKVGRGAFASSGIKTITLSGLTEIGEGAFRKCRNLSRVDLSGCRLEELPPYLFYECVTLKEILLSGEIKKVGKHAFEKCDVASLSLPQTVVIEDFAMADCPNLTEIEFASGCRMGEGVFYGDQSLEKLYNNPGNIPELFAFSSPLDNILTIDVANVGEGAFSSSTASSIILGEEVREISPYAFHAMSNLEKVDAVKCKSIPTADDNSFSGVDVAKVVLYVPSADSIKWKEAPVWRDFNIVCASSGVEEIQDSGNSIDITYDRHAIWVSTRGEAVKGEIFSLDGVILETFRGDNGHTFIPFPEGMEMVVVRATDGKETKIVKLKR